ncbi:aldo/keto reductase [Patescibacteria group bacterium]|nr:aldo/keto reductase [Patescibacteria group bacterium]
MSNKAILGTVKFGIQDYGFSSLKSQAKSGNLLNLAHKYGVDTLDTSPRYGNSESVIGEYHAKNSYIFKVCTKVDNLEAASLSSEKRIFDSVVNSIRVSRVSHIETLYLHQNEMEIISDDSITTSLEKLKNSGLVKKIGVSIYSAEECKFALESHVYDVIQLPISILDSYIYSNLIANNSINKEIIGRSIFLQGILFNRKDIKNKIKQSKKVFDYISKLDNLASEYNIDLITMACSFAFSLTKVDGIIIGTNVEKNLLDIINASKFKMTKELQGKLTELSCEYKEWGNPRNW